MNRLGILDSNQKIVSSGLIFLVDSAQLTSYPGSGTAWNDLSGNGRNGTLTNGPTFNSSNGGSIVFDGANDYVSVGNPLAFNNISVCIWMYQTNTGFRCPISNEPAGGSLNGWAIRQRSSTYWAVIGREGSADFANGGSVNLNVWTYLCNTYNGTTITLYQNGSSAATAASSRTVDTTTNLTIACLPSLGEFFQGRIGVVQVYNRALSATEVLQNFNADRIRFGL